MDKIDQKKNLIAPTCEPRWTINGVTMEAEGPWLRQAARVEVVPASQLAGAVEAMAEAYGYLIHDERDAALVHLETALEAAGVDPATYRGRS